MAFTVSGLSEYTQKATELLVSQALFADNFSNYTIEQGIQHSKYLNYLSADPHSQAGACGLSTSGTTTLTEKEITVKSIAYRDSWCIDTLNEKDLNFSTGTLNGVMIPDLQTKLLFSEAQAIKADVEAMLFTGSLASGDYFNGWVTQISGDSAVVDSPSTGITLTSSNIDDYITEMILAIPAKGWARNQMYTIHMSLANYNLYRVNRIANNMYHDNPKNKGLLQMEVFGWEGFVQIQADPGMGTSKVMFATWDQNLVIGTDNITELAAAKIYFDENTDYVKYKASMKLGCTYMFGDEIVYFLGA